MIEPELIDYIKRVEAARKIVSECQHHNCSNDECMAARLLIAEDDQRRTRALEAAREDSGDLGSGSPLSVH